MKKLIVSTLASLAVAAGTAATAAAKPCKDVDIHVYNDFVHDGFPLQIKVVDFDYWDDENGKWREEAFGGSTIYNPGEDFHLVDDRNLEYVGGTSGVVVRIQFKYLTSNNGWSETLTAESLPHTCTDGEHFNVIVE